MNRFVVYILLVASILLAATSVYARTMRVYGYVTDIDNRGIELVNVTAQDEKGIIDGTSTNKNGYYTLSLEETDSLELIFSMVGYVTTRQRIVGHQDVVNINVSLPTDEQWIEEVEVRGIKRTSGTMDQIDAGTTRLMPDATGGSIESILITFYGVNQNNELSSQYNVRGGSFDENEVYVNGIEIHRPLLIRSGQQEGLSFVNPEMVQNVQFSAGGFGAQYGDKMSSVLDIAYKRPTRFEASLSASLLGASAYVGHGDSTFSQMHGIRYKTSRYMLGALQTAGNYQPNFVDYQTYMNWRVGKNPSHGTWNMSFIGNVSLNDYRFTPDSLTENFGGYENAKKLTIWYEGQEKDRFLTAFAALSANGEWRKSDREKVRIGFDLSGFYTSERETFDITGAYALEDAQMDSNSSSSSRSSEEINDVQNVLALGTGIYHEHVRNYLEAGVVTLAHHGEWQRGNNTLSWGVSGQAELIADRISEWEWRDSAGYSLPNNAETMELYYSMRGESKMQSARLQAYIQNTYRWNLEKCRILLTVGGRLNWWTFTNEVLPSPRASVEFIPGWKRDISFRLATGLYYQAPFYKELRDTITDAGGVTRIHLNNNLRAQRSVHAVAGLDYYFRAWGRPFKFSTELYYKYMDRLVSYTVDNVRVRYSGKNDAYGYAAGVDLKLYGELVPGADSWISFSAMSAKQQLMDHPEWGWIPLPQEQRYSFSMLFQDYFPRLPQLIFHIKFIWSDGLPFSSPRNIQAMKVFRTPPYRRLDIGATYAFNAKTAKFMRQPSAKHVSEWALQFEVFNLVGWKNVNSYFWASDTNGNYWASPNYLTGRMFNFKIRVDLK
ncbi:MAG: TonB-dependent receptor [Paludibacteraceae bacterium]|nr:TonB-dependent receptor [Paludibacteraceae bacterium]